MASPNKKKPLLPARPSGKGKAPANAAPAPVPNPDLDPRGTMLYTIGFTLAVFFFVIGMYQMVVEQDIIGNYWLVMISAGLLLGLRTWRAKALRG